MKILVIGGTGKVGAEVVKELQKRRADIRLFVRKDGTPTPPGVEVAIGDLLDPVSVEKAMHGVDKLYLLNAVSPDELTQALIAYDLAKKLKLKHMVYHSVFRVEHFKDVPHFASKLAIENALQEFEVPFTIIRPNYFIQNDATLKDALMAGVYPMPLGNVGISVVDIRDIAEATAIVLTSEEHNGKTYNLNGPEAISGPKASSIPEDLTLHKCAGSGPWKLSKGKKVVMPNILFRVVTSDPTVALKLALSGFGIVILPLWVAKNPDVREDLVQILPRWVPEPITLCALFSSPSRLTPKVQVLLDFLDEYLGTDRDPRLKNDVAQGYFSDRSLTPTSGP